MLPAGQEQADHGIGSLHIGDMAVGDTSLNGGKMKTGRYYCAHLHMHSCFESKASMEGHMFEASRIGVEVIWFTDHDSRIGRKKSPVDGFDFEKDKLLVVCSKEEVEEEIKKIQDTMNNMGVFLDDERWKQSRSLLDNHVESSYGWRQVDLENQGDSEVALTKDRTYKGNQCMKISLSSNKDHTGWQGAAVGFSSSGNRHQYSLLSMVKLKIACFIESDIGEDSRIIFDVKMSQHPPEHKNSRLKYVIGNTEGLQDQYSGVIPVKADMGKWQEIFLSLSDDVSYFQLGGQDNVFDTLSITVEARAGAGLTCFFDDFEIITQLHGEQARKRQQDFANDLGGKFSVMAIAGTEISAAGPHKNCFSTKVPLIDYYAKNYNITQEEAIDWVFDHGGIFSINHPFDFWKRIFVNEAEREQVVNKLLELYSISKCYGASLLEVGFPEGRHKFELEDYLKLWDGLGKNGIFITGYGDSDNHANDSNWWDGNNFSSWIYAEELTEENLLESMKAGNLYTGDPVIFRGQLSFETTEGYRMGQVIKADKNEYILKFEATLLKPGWTVKWIVDGKMWRTEKAATENYIDAINIIVHNKVHFARVEIYDETNRCVLLTNPIYIINDNNIFVPEERRVKV